MELTFQWQISAHQIDQVQLVLCRSQYFLEGWCGTKFGRNNFPKISDIFKILVLSTTFMTTKSKADTVACPPFHAE